MENEEERKVKEEEETDGKEVAIGNEAMEW